MCCRAVFTLCEKQTPTVGSDAELETRADVVLYLWIWRWRKDGEQVTQTSLESGANIESCFPLVAVC